ncbi:hypothetical protein ACUXK4_000702 [Methylorubrum extorquens]|jgi:hypothetical protein
MSCRKATAKGVPVPRAILGSPFEACAWLRHLRVRALAGMTYGDSLSIKLWILPGSGVPSWWL